MSPSIFRTGRGPYLYERTSAQAVRPVRWEETVRKLEALGCWRIIEVGPGKVLAGLIKRISRSLEVENFAAVPDLARTRAETVA